MSINPGLRDHVTRVGFNLSLGRTHIAALVELDISLQRDEYINTVHSAKAYRFAFRNDIVGRQGLEDRGLIIHHSDAHPEPGENFIPRRRLFTITEAGKAVITLLKEAGIYQEYAAALPAPRSEMAG